MRCYKLVLSLLLALLPGAICSRACAEGIDDYAPPLHTLARAAFDGNLSLVKKMLAQNPALLNKPVNLCSPISFAAWHGKVEVARYLLEKGAKLTAEDPDKAPLSKAAAAQNIEIIDMLLAKGADPKFGCPLYWASNNPAVFRHLVEKGADIHALGINKESLLWDTVAELNMDNTRFLLEHGMDVNKGQFGCPPLNNIARFTFEDTPTEKVLNMARFLLGKGADPNLADESWHRSALSEAVIEKFPAMARLLLTYESPVRCSKATINAARKDLHFAASKTDKLTKKDVAALQEIAELLHEPLTDLPVSEQARAVPATPLPADPLFAAACNGDTKVLQRLVKGGKSLKAKDKDGRTPLHFAALGGRLEVAKWLLSQGAELNARDTKGATPLALARQDTEDAKLAARRAELISFLSEKGAVE